MASLKAHLLLHEKEENLVCPECGEEYGTQGQLDRHLREHIDDGMYDNDVYACKYCQMQFNKLSTLREHLKQHAKIKNSLSHKSYKRNVDRTGFQHKCTHCTKSFQKPSQLKRHVLIHTGERPFKCTMCNKAFNQKGALSIHLMKHTNERPHVCQFCPQRFSQRGNLRSHIERVHTEISSTHVFRCDQCNCAFKKLGSLHAHMSRVHTGVVVEGSGEASAQVGVSRVLSDPKSKADENSAKVASLSALSEVHQAMSQQAVYQQLLELSDQVAEAPHNSDLLQQALENSGLPIDSGEAIRIKLEEQKEKGRSAEEEIPADDPTTSAAEKDQGGVMTMTIQDSITGALKKHTIRRVGGVRWHQCMYCSKEFKKPSDLIRHIRIHTHEKPYKCTQCFRAFAVKSTLTAHLKTHSGIKDYKCSLCQKMFSTHGSLKVHQRLHTGARPFDCPLCDKKFRTSGHSRTHVQSHFREENAEGASPKKPRRSIRKSNQGEADLPDIPLQEPILITDTGYIQQPSRTGGVMQYLGETSSVDRPYKCSYCARGFKKSSHLKQHVRSHTGEKPYKCVKCLKAFVSSGVLKSHIRTHTGVKAYKCPICNAPFTTNGSLKRHMSTHSEVRPFMCPYCSKRFKTSVNCKKHMKTHKHELAMQAAHQQRTEQQITVDQQTVSVSQVSHCTHTLIKINGGNHLDQQALNLHQLQAADPNTITVGPGGEVLNTQTSNELVLQDALVSDVQLQSTLNHQVCRFITENNIIIINILKVLTSMEQQPSQDMSQTLLSSAANNSFNQMSLGQLLPVSELFLIIDYLVAREPDPNVPMDADREWRVTIPEESAGVAKRYRCSLCGKAFKKSSHLRQHHRSHSGEKPFQCPECRKSFVSNSVMKNHMRTHLGTKSFSCYECGAFFTTNGSLKRHRNIHSSEKFFKCPTCNENFRTAINCKRHMKMHQVQAETENQEEEENAEKEMKARIRPVITISDQQAHELSQTAPTEAMSVSEKILIESAAEKTRVSEVRLAEVEAVPVMKKEGFHQCEHCSKSFKKPSDLVRHTRIHTGEKPYKCDVCMRAFTVKSTLDSHLKTHQQNKKFHCHVCMSPFSTRGSLKVHMRLHTGAKPFKCPHCTQRFRTSGHRKSHIAQHFKPAVPRKPKMITTEKAARSVDNNLMSVLDLENATVTEVQPQQVTDLMTSIQPNGQDSSNQIVNMDQSMINHMPVSLSFTDMYGNIQNVDPSNFNLDGVQLHLTGTQGIQITGLENAGLLNQTIQIDASVLQQLQQQQQQQQDVAEASQSLDVVNPNAVIQSLPSNVDESNFAYSVIVQSPERAEVNQGEEMDEFGESVLSSERSVPLSESHPSAAVAIHPSQLAAGITAAKRQHSPPPVLMDVSYSQNKMNGCVTILFPNYAHLFQSSVPRGSSPTLLYSNLTCSRMFGIITHFLKTISSICSVGDFQSALISANSGGSAAGASGVRLPMFPSWPSWCQSAMPTSSVMIFLLGYPLSSPLAPSPWPDARRPAPAPGRRPTWQPAAAGHRAARRPGVLPLMDAGSPICQKSFKRRGHLKEHLFTHAPRSDPSSSARPLPYVCPECDKSFCKPSLLERHLRIHTGERPFVCNVCRKAFNQKNTLQIHMRRHSGARPHVCPYCEYSFSQKGNLKTHIKRYHHAEMREMMDNFIQGGGAEVSEGSGVIKEGLQEAAVEVNVATEALKAADDVTSHATGTALDLSDVLIM
ncbi:hypothetical protein CAPTEDRAFT_173460 [Capitella teleta]|uniref:C2H2-type domain-containing protein n=1 Tax=Capitella teleta TaxID=283909 RepID=R7T3B3_CAPTE|nr:hypothetical protein CAPTEDRAFT_173460 [Capitella teleta]|eukprot:ELT87081.1 hypothetical protein CAPTEDRAFT_173460 [Capitella teleta]